MAFLGSLSGSSQFSLLTTDLVPGKVGKACFNTLMSANPGSSYVSSRDCSNSSRKLVSINAAANDGRHTSLWASHSFLERQFRQVQFDRNALETPCSVIEMFSGGGMNGGSLGGRGDGGFGGGDGSGWNHSQDDNQNSDSNWWLLYSSLDSSQPQKALMWQVLCFLGMLQTMHFLLFTNHTCEPLLWDNSEEEDDYCEAVGESMQVASVELLMTPCSYASMYTVPTVPLSVS